MNLSQEQIEKLWGDGGPYSQVNLVFENRILDESEARRYYYIHVEINPLTFEIVEKNLDDFQNDKEVMGIYETHEEREDGNGYNAYPFRVQVVDEEDDKKEAQKALVEIKKAVIRMHKYAMKVLSNLDKV